MSVLPTLIKQQNFLVDEQRKVLASAEEIVARLQARIDELVAEFNREKEASKSMPYALGIGEYIARTLDQQENLNILINQAEAAAEAEREKLRDLYAELKKYEQVHQNQLDAAAREQARLEQIETDEIAGQRHQRS